MTSERRDVHRRFERSWNNFCEIYKPLADLWVVYDNSGDTPRLIETSPLKQRKMSPEDQRFYDSVKGAMPAAARRARKIARMYGTPIIVWENGRIVAKKP